MKGRDRLGDAGIDERIILRWSIKKYGSREWTLFT
jgi:hypothetical protein